MIVSLICKKVAWMLLKVWLQRRCSNVSQSSSYDDVAWTISKFNCDKVAWTILKFNLQQCCLNDSCSLIATTSLEWLASSIAMMLLEQPPSLIVMMSLDKAQSLIVMPITRTILKIDCNKIAYCNKIVQTIATRLLQKCHNGQVRLRQCLHKWASLNHENDHKLAMLLHRWLQKNKSQALKKNLTINR